MCTITYISLEYYFEVPVLSSSYRSGATTMNHLFQQGVYHLFSSISALGLYFSLYLGLEDIARLHSSAYSLSLHVRYIIS
jgi:hypothetical protein